MDLWIRNQDRTILIKANSLLIDDNRCVIYTNEQMGNNTLTYTLGEYKSKKRTLEVLDEIERQINDGYADVYQMPEE